VLIVLYANKETIAAKLLSSKGFVGIGLISYSAYLWHQPLFAFARIRLLEHPSFILMLFLSILSILLAYFSWRYVEKPFRKAVKFSKKTIFQLSALGIFLFLTFGLSVNYVNGKFTKTSYPPNIKYESLGNRISNEGLPCVWSKEFDESNAYIGCIFGDTNADENIVLVGDSHSQSISYTLNEWAISNQKRVIWLRMNGCEYLPNLVRNHRPPSVNCNNNHEQLLSLIDTLNADVILLHRWTYRMYPVDEIELTMPFRNSFGDIEVEAYVEFSVYKNGNFYTSQAAKTKLLKDYVTSIANASRRLFLIYPVPETAINIFERNLYHWQNNGEVISDIFIKEDDYQTRNEFVLDTFENLASDNIIPIRPRNLLCEESKCFLQRNGIPLYLDDDHLGDTGARLIVNKINNFFID